MDKGLSHLAALKRMTVMRHASKGAASVLHSYLDVLANLQPELVQQHGAGLIH